jgi:hypothetical protein
MPSPCSGAPEISTGQVEGAYESTHEWHSARNLTSVDNAAILDH